MLIVAPLTIDAQVVSVIIGAVTSHWFAIDFVDIRLLYQVVWTELIIASFWLLRSKLLFDILKERKDPVIDTIFDGMLPVRPRPDNLNVCTLVNHVKVLGIFPFTKGIVWICIDVGRAFVKFGNGIISVVSEFIFNTVSTKQLSVIVIFKILSQPSVVWSNWV